MLVTDQGLMLDPGIVLLPASCLYQHFAGFGLTPEGFTAFRRAIGVPAIIMPDGTELIDLDVFKLAIKELARYGNNDFNVPEEGNKAFGSRIHRHEKEWKQVVVELMVHRLLDSNRSVREVEAQINASMNRLRMMLSARADITFSNYRACVDMLSGELEIPQIGLNGIHDPWTTQGPKYSGPRGP